MFTLVALAIAVLTKLGCALVSHIRLDSWLCRVRSRRTSRSELSMVRSVVELLMQDENFGNYPFTVGKNLLRCSHSGGNKADA